jgi:hypothetical protein
MIRNQTSAPHGLASTALLALLSHWQPVTGILDHVDLVRFRPVEVLRSFACPPHDLELLDEDCRANVCFPPPYEPAGTGSR